MDNHLVSSVWIDSDDLLWILYVFICLEFGMPLCASISLCLVVTCWEMADLLALVCGV